MTSLGDNPQPGRLLIVDDEPFNLEILTEHLEDAGFEVAAAADGIEAMALLNAPGARYDALLLDRMMPRMNGMEVLRAIKNDGHLKSLPVIMQTAMGSPQAVREGLAAGAYYYLTKPFERDTLLAIVHAAIRDRREQLLLLDQLSAQRDTLTLLQSAAFRFQTLGQAKNLSALLSCVCPNPEKIALGLAELLINAVEHGNLGISYAEKSELLHANRWRQEVEERQARPEYAMKSVTVTLSRQEDLITFVIVDEGQGFDWLPFLDFTPERAFDPHGRGISMARTLSFDQLDYQGCGNQVTAVVRLQG